MESKVPVVFKAFAWLIFIGGFIAGITCGTVETTTGYYSKITETEFSLARAAVYWLSSFAAGMLFYGMGEIIQLLGEISTLQAQQVSHCASMKATVTAMEKQVNSLSQG